MSAQLVPTARTVVTAQALYGVLHDAWTALLGTEPTRAQLLTLLSQWALETGNGQACNNWNMAGIKHVAGDGHDWASYQTTEVLGGQVVHLAQDFRSYPSLEAGAADYLVFLHSRFGFAWPAVEAADVRDFAHRLKLRGYYTAPEDQYAAGLVARYHQLDAMVPQGPTAGGVVEVARDERSVDGPVKDGYGPRGST